MKFQNVVLQGTRSKENPGKRNGALHTLDFQGLFPPFLSNSRKIYHISIISRAGTEQLEDDTNHGQCYFPGDSIKEPRGGFSM